MENLKFNPIEEENDDQDDFEAEMLLFQQKITNLARNVYRRSY